MYHSQSNCVPVLHVHYYLCIVLCYPLMIRVWLMYMFVSTLYKLSMSVYGYVFVWKCNLCLPVFVR